MNFIFNLDCKINSVKIKYGVMRRRTLYSNKNYDPIEANYGDICFYDSDTDEFIISKVEDIFDYSANNYTPIGIVAVPSSHTNNHRPRIMSLVEMNCDTPESGSTEDESMLWGIYDTMINDLTIKTKFAYLAEHPSGVTIDATVKFWHGGCRIPSDCNGQNGFDNWTITNPANKNEHFNNTGRSYNYMCSPYKEDGSKDERYFDFSDTGNVFTDFNGRSNTDKILEHRGVKDYSTWKPTYNNGADYPPVSCCDMFHTIGTKQRDWYLPSIGELGYVISRMQTIQNNLQALKNHGYVTCLIRNYMTFEYWSSTQFEEHYICVAEPMGGVISYSLKGNDGNGGHYENVRAFLQL